MTESEPVQFHRIRSEDEYQAALLRVLELMDAAPGSPEGEELDVWVDLLTCYEARTDMPPPRQDDEDPRRDVREPTILARLGRGGGGTR